MTPITLILRTQPRKGGMMVCVLVCLFVSIAIVAGSVHHAVRMHREVRLQQQMLQTQFLLDAGILRAVERLNQTPDYQGETWHPETAITRYPNPLVEIRVDADRVDVTASLGIAVEAGQQLIASRTKRSHTFTVNEPNTSKVE
jgi:hypothetical protein